VCDGVLASVPDRPAWPWPGNSPLVRPRVIDRLMAEGNRRVQLRLHVRHRALSVPTFDLGLDDTAYP